MKTVDYSSPSVEVAEVEVEGILCASVDIEVGDGGYAFDEE